MEKETTVRFKKRLEEEKVQLEEQIREYEKPVDLGSDVDSMDEEADEAEEIDRGLTLASDLKKRLEQIESALLKIDAGTYGKCESCGGEISLEMLETVPESRLCLNCKKQNIKS